MFWICVASEVSPTYSMTMKGLPSQTSMSMMRTMLG